MTGPVEKMLLGFARGVRSRKRRLAVLVIAGWVLAAQALLVVHGIEHDNGGVACALCAAAHHQTVTPALPSPAIVRSPPERIENIVGISRDVLRALPYHSRAPPAILESQ